VKKVSTCVLCSGKIELRKKALVAPFLARLIWGRTTFHVELVECVDCGFIFYNPRLEPGEEERLYSGYRSDEYQQMRQAFEPWYTKKFNHSLQSPDIIALRQQRLSELFRARLSLASSKVLDFGGNRGELVKGLIPGAEPFVYDISGVAPLDGVGHCRDLAACKAGQFDLIVNSNVLEHVGFPRVLIDQLTSIAAPGTLAFIEVPCESPFERMAVLKRVVQEALLAVLRPRVAVSLARPSMLYLMHEHINFYTPKSLAALMTASGWSVVDSAQYSINSPFGKSWMAWCLAKKS
jgi:hypothetical protein